VVDPRPRPLHRVRPGDRRLECEAGVTLDEVIEIALPQGWFLPVTPGTRYVTLGGAIANDVHGKNHHGAGTFGEHVEALTCCAPTAARSPAAGARGRAGFARRSAASA
jgi:FAD/FMN-containing dehydrogenase